MDYEVRKNKPHVQVPQPEVEAPNYAAIIVQDAIEMFAQHNKRIYYVEIAPFIYPELAKSLGQDVSFPVLYGVMALDIYGLPAYVRMSPTLEESRGGWHEAYWYELHYQDHEEEDLRPLDSLIVKIVRTWESCQMQCERGFECPLLAEIGVDLDGTVLQCCTALRDIETIMGGNLLALDEANKKFAHDNTHGLPEEDKSEQEEKEHESGSSVEVDGGLGGEERPSEDEGRRDDGDSL